MNAGPERRREVRRKVLKGARIFCHQLGTSTDCTVRNLSQTGACLVVAGAAAVPNEFGLTLGDQSTRGCRVIWRAANRIGVSFC